MELQSLSTLAEVISSIGVIISLIYLARQIKMSNKLSHAQTRRDMLEAGQQELYKLVDNPKIVDAFINDDLTNLEIYQFHTWLLANIRSREFEWFQMQNELLDKSAFEAYNGITIAILGTERTRRWWDEFKFFYDNGFVLHVDNLLANSPLSEYWSVLESSKWWHGNKTERP